MPVKTRYPDIMPFTTLDGSSIRELMHPQHHAVTRQSLAEARIPAGGQTRLHRHMRSEELYHVTAGSGVMQLGDDSFAITPGDTVCIPPATPHRVDNIGDNDLVILCCCSPAYSDDDTELL